MVDRIVDFEGDTKCTGVKNVTINEPYFRPLPRPPDHARRAATRGDGPGFLGADAPQTGKHRAKSATS
jgi:hypothetical protein